MASNQVVVQRSEAFFRVCNDRNAKAPYLRNKARIIGALGVLAVSEAKVKEIMDWVVDIWRRGGPVSLNTRTGKDRRRNITTQVSTQFPEVFNMPCSGPEESDFLREKAIHAMIYYATTRVRDRRPKASRGAGPVS